MPISQAFCTSAKVELLQATHNFDTDAFSLALFKTSPSGTYGAATTNYSDMTGNSDENTGTGYSAGGIALTNTGVTSSGTTAYADWSDISWAASTISSSGGLIYSTTNANAAICVLDFGATISSVSGTFVITFPTYDAANAIIRIA